MRTVGRAVGQIIQPRGHNIVAFDRTHAPSEVVTLTLS